MNILLYCPKPLQGCGFEFLVNELYPQANIVQVNNFLGIGIQLENCSFDVVLVDAVAPVDYVTNIISLLLRKDYKLIVQDSFRDLTYQNKLLEKGVSAIIAESIPKDDFQMIFKWVVEKNVDFYVSDFALVNLPPKANMTFAMSKSEEQVMTLLFQGKTVSQISHEFEKKDDTIATIKMNMLKKAGVNNLMDFHKIMQFRSTTAVKSLYRRHH